MHNKKGFSLFELMIVIGIIAILSAITVPNLISWYRNQGLKNAVVELQSNLHLAKMAAVKQNQNCSVNINTAAGSYASTCMNKIVSLGTYSGGVVFRGPVGNEAISGVVTFNSRGLCNLSIIYLTNKDRSGFYKIQTLVSGGIVTSKLNS